MVRLMMFIFLILKQKPVRRFWKSFTQRYSMAPNAYNVIVCRVLTKYINALKVTQQTDTKTDSKNYAKAIKDY